MYHESIIIKVIFINLKEKRPSSVRSPAQNTDHHLARITRTGDLRTVDVATNTSNLENGVNDTTNTLSGNEASSNGIGKNIELVLVAPLPNVANNGTDKRSGGVNGGHDSEAHGHNHHVRPVGTDPLALTDEVEVADEDHGASPEGKDDGEDTGGCRDGEGRVL